MPKKPTLTIADPKSDTALSPPTTLGKTGAALWQTIMNEYRIDVSRYNYARAARQAVFRAMRPLQRAVGAPNLAW